MLSEPLQRLKMLRNKVSGRRQARQILRISPTKIPPHRVSQLNKTKGFSHEIVDLTTLTAKTFGDGEQIDRTGKNQICSCFNELAQRFIRRE